MTQSIKFSLEHENHRQLQTLCGPNNQNIDYIEQEMSIDIKQRGVHFKIYAEDEHTLTKAQRLIEQLYDYCEQNDSLDFNDINIHKHELEITKQETHRYAIKPKTKNQAKFLQAIENNTITFGIGPAGTGKTLLATASAIQQYKQNHISKIIISRPVVESGEQLGFLPGDIHEKIHPYMVPLFDCLTELIGLQKLNKHLEDKTIEIVPLAYMRGRSLKNACIILDEAQNSTISQMKMFLTRIADNSRMIINGDTQQIDLKTKRTSGLLDACERLKDINDIAVVNFSKYDAIRHPLIHKIIQAYDPQD